MLIELVMFPTIEEVEIYLGLKGQIPGSPEYERNMATWQALYNPTNSQLELNLEFNSEKEEIK